MRIDFGFFPGALSLCFLAGCAPAVVTFDEVEEGRVSRVSLAGVDAPGSVSGLPEGEAVRLADAELRRRVRRPEAWSLVYCRRVTLRPGWEAYAVRFDRKGAYEDARAGDKFLKFYVLADRRVLAADIVYAD